jgi:site-specific DNA-methyltransferase (adenine-specific)
MSARSVVPELRKREGTLAEVLAGSADWCVVEGDCLEVLPTIPDKAVAHVITDPPYSERVHARFGKEGRTDDTASRVALSFTHFGADEIAKTSAELVRVVSRWLVVFTDDLLAAGWIAGVVDAGGEYVRKGAWVKTNPMPQMTGDRPGSGFEEIIIGHGRRAARKLRNTHPRVRMQWNGGGRAAVWVENGQEGERQHPTQKPIVLMLALVSDFTAPGELVLDAFCGSGTTGVACLRLGRRFIGIEKDPKYAAVARERLRAESQGLSLRDARAGQLPMFGAP